MLNQAELQVIFQVVLVKMLSSTPYYDEYYTTLCYFFYIIIEAYIRYRVYYYLFCGIYGLAYILNIKTLIVN